MALDINLLENAIVGGVAGEVVGVVGSPFEAPDEKKTEIKFFPGPKTAVLKTPAYGFVSESTLPNEPTVNIVNNQYAQATITIDPSITGSYVLAHAKETAYQYIVREVSTSTGVDYGSLTASTASDQIVWNYDTSATSGYTTVTGTGYWNAVTQDDLGNITIGYTTTDWKDVVKEAIRSNLLIRTGRNRRSLANADPKELKARDTLRDMLTERDWRRYVTNGFIMVKGSKDFSFNGVHGPFWYQVFNDKQRVLVFHQGKHVHSICIHTDSVCPPSDHVINIKVLAEIDEAQIWAGGNISSGDTMRWATTNGSGAMLGHTSQPQASSIVSLAKQTKSSGAVFSAISQGYIAS